MAELRTYRAHCALFYTQNDDSETTECDTHYVHLKSDVDAALAAKDARIAELEAKAIVVQAAHDDVLRRLRREEIAALEIDPLRKKHHCCICGKGFLTAKVCSHHEETCDAIDAKPGAPPWHRVTRMS